MCKRCEDFKYNHPYIDGKHVGTNFGSKIICCFGKNGVFKTDNWNCMTMGVLRDLIQKHGYTQRDDANSGSLDVLHIPENGIISGYLVLSYYKSGGRISWAYIFNDDEQPELLTEDNADIIIDAYNNKRDG